MNVGFGDRGFGTTNFNSVYLERGQTIRHKSVSTYGICCRADNDFSERWARLATPFEISIGHERKVPVSVLLGQHALWCKFQEPVFFLRPVGRVLQDHSEMKKAGEYFTQYVY